MLFRNLEMETQKLPRESQMFKWRGFWSPDSAKSSVIPPVLKVSFPYCFLVCDTTILIYSFILNQ